MPASFWWTFRTLNFETRSLVRGLRAALRLQSFMHFANVLARGPAGSLDQVFVRVSVRATSPLLCILLLLYCMSVWSNAAIAAAACDDSLTTTHHPPRLRPEARPAGRHHEPRVTGCRLHVTANRSGPRLRSAEEGWLSSHPNFARDCHVHDM